MNEKGYVVAILDKDIARVKMTRHSACANCGKCPGSRSKDPESKEIEVEVYNAVGAVVGDQVEVSMNNMKVLKAAALAYLIPFFTMMVGIALAYFIGRSVNLHGYNEIFMGFLALVGVCLGFLYLKLNDKKYKKSREFMPTITRVVTDIDLNQFYY